jgi:hypothetical protein
MNVKAYEPQYTATLMNVTKKKEEIAQRKQYLKEKNASSTTTQKKEYNSSILQNKLDAIDVEETQNTKYYYTEISKAEDKHSGMVSWAEEKIESYRRQIYSEVSKSEEKLINYKKYCMDAIERIKEKSETKRSAIELKKNNTEVEFDDSSDQQLIKLNIELKELEEKAERAENWMNVYIARDREAYRAEQELKHYEAAREKAKADAKQNSEEEVAYYKLIDETDAEENKRYAEDQALRKKQREEEITEENRQLYKQRTELKKVMTDKQYKNYYKISRDERLGFLRMSTDAILAKLK